MKNLLLLIILIACSYATFAAKCHAVTKAGTQCTRNATTDSLCSQHARMKTGKILSIQYIETKSGFAYTKEVYANHAEKTFAIPLAIYPNWKKADSLANRGTKAWMKIAGQR